jgi:hypothetical protein
LQCPELVEVLAERLREFVHTDREHAVAALAPNVYLVGAPDSTVFKGGNSLAIEVLISPAVVFDEVVGTSMNRHGPSVHRVSELEAHVIRS